MKRYILSGLAIGALTVALGQAQTPEDTVEAQRHAQRDVNQADRIQQGVNNGSLTPGQGAALQSRDRAINREAARMAARNGGTLSQAQERRIHRQMNRQSRRIYRAKHY